jgi:hypothetical protein
MFNLLGMKPEEIITQAQSAVKALEEKLTCLEDRLAAIQRTLEYEYGRPRRDVAGHDPARLPLISQIDVYGIPTGEVFGYNRPHLDVAGVLGKPATRGHLVNMGYSNVQIWFSYGSSKVGPYILPPSAALEISFLVEKVEFEVDLEGGYSKIQVLFQ